MWEVESSYGTKGIAVITKSIGNERSYSNDPNKNFKGFAKYDSSEEALKATLENLKRLEKATKGSIKQLIVYWAPPKENKTGLYTKIVEDQIRKNQERIEREIKSSN